MIVYFVYLQAHNPLLLMLKPSKADQARAFLKFFQVNFWYNIILFVQDIFVSDGFYEQIKCNMTDSKWNINCKIVSDRISTLDLHKLATSILGNEPKIVVIHAGFSLVRRIFKVVSEANVTTINHAWFITETSFTRDHHSLFPFPSGTLSIVPTYAVNVEDVILDGTNFIIKSVINNLSRTTVARHCWNASVQDYAAVGHTVLRYMPY